MKIFLILTDFVDLGGYFVLSEKELATASDTDEDGDFSRFVFTMGTSF